MDVPASLRRWFVAHFGVNLLIGAPLLLVPETFLRALGWSTIDGSSARFGGAALLAVGVQSLLTRDAGVSTLRMMLNFKLVWSWAVITGLVFAAADNAPDPVWVLLAFFLGLSSVWFHFRMQLDGEDGEDEDHDQDALPAGGDELSELLHLESMAANAQQGHATNSFDSMGAQDINALFAAQQAEEARKAAAEAAAEAARRKAAEEPPPRTTMQGLSPAKRAEMDELDALLAASASTGIDDKKAERLADLLAARKAAREAAAGVLEDEAPSEQAGDPEALGEDDIAAMLAKGPEEATMGEGDIAAMLANGPEEKTLGEGDIAAMLAGAADEDSVGGDDIAAMLAGNDAPTEKRAADEAESADDEAQATEAEAQATEADEPPAQEAVAADAPDAEELAVAPEAAPPEAPAPEEDAPAGSDEIAAMLAGKDENVSSEDLAALLAGNEGGSSEPPSLPTLRGRAESALELEDHDEAILFADETPPPEPTEAVLADVVDAPPGDTLDEAAGEDAIAAMLAASRAEDAKAES
jgi:hypothetical protein